MSEMRYSKKHLWVKTEDNKATIGITDYAQEKLGNILFLNLPDCDEEISIGEAFGDIESVKTVSDLISPVSGVVIAVNEDLMNEPDEINENPYDSWFIEVEVSAEHTELMSDNQYKEYLETL
jgi:glycine cleavage system H protein